MHSAVLPALHRWDLEAQAGQVDAFSLCCARSFPGFACISCKLVCYHTYAARFLAWIWRRSGTDMDSMLLSLMMASGQDLRGRKGGLCSCHVEVARGPSERSDRFSGTMQLRRASLWGMACLVLSSQGKLDSDSQRILLDDVKTITCHRGQMTTARRLDPVPQLTCTGKLCSKFTPRTVQCQNRGDSQWKCEAQLPVWAQLGDVQVSCEGWDSSEDPYVLKGSCAVQFELLPTTTKMSGGLESVLFSIGFWTLFAFILLSFFHHCLGSEAEPDATITSDSDEPPPYTKHNTKRFSSPITRALTALGLGTLAGYLFRTETRTTPTTHEPYMPFPGYGTMPHHGVYYGDAATQLQSNNFTSNSPLHTSTSYGETENR